MILVSVDSCDSVKVSYLSDALPFIQVAPVQYSYWLNCSIYIVLVRYYIVSDAGPVVNRFDGCWHGCPWVAAPHVFLVRRCGRHVIVQSLESAVVGGWIETDIVSWISRVVLLLNIEFFPVQLGRNIQSHLVGTSGRPHRNLSDLNGRLGPLAVEFSFPVAMHIDVLGDIFLREGAKVAVGVHT